MKKRKETIIELLIIHCVDSRRKKGKLLSVLQLGDLKIVSEKAGLADGKKIKGR